MLGQRFIVAVSTLLLAGGCGRSALEEPSVNDAGPVVEDPVSREEPLAIFTRPPWCPVSGSEADMRATPSSVLVVAPMKYLFECSGVGGEWLVARDGLRDLFVGGHACFFLGPSPLEAPPWAAFPSLVAVIRLHETAALYETVQGWCIIGLDGREPLSSNRFVDAWAVFRTSAGAHAAAKRWQ